MIFIVNNSNIYQIVLKNHSFVLINNSLVLLYIHQKSMILMIVSLEYKLDWLGLKILSQKVLKIINNWFINIYVKLIHYRYRIKLKLKFRKIYWQQRKVYILNYFKFNNKKFIIYLLYKC